MAPKKIFAICGSTKQRSSNLMLIELIKKLSVELFEITIYKELALLPHFNPDLDTEIAPPAVANFRNLLSRADGVLICTPEYAMGVPGTLKNALDWTVSSMDLSGKPVALITASLNGEMGHQALLATLNVIECKLSTATQLRIPFIASKFGQEGELLNEVTLTEVKELIAAFDELTN